MHAIVERYGKELIREIMDMILIDGSVDHEVMRKLLIKHKIIGATTKTLYTYFSLVKTRYAPNGHYVVKANNGRNQNKFYIRFPVEELPQILEDIR